MSTMVKRDLLLGFSIPKGEYPICKEFLRHSTPDIDHQQTFECFMLK